MAKKKPGSGVPVSNHDRRIYELLRERVLLSPTDAAELIGRSRSWAYDYERKRRIANVPPAGVEERKDDPPPAKDLSDAVELVLALDRDDEEGFYEILMHFGVEIVFSVCELAAFLARLYVYDYLVPQNSAGLSPRQRQAEQEAMAQEGFSDVDLFLPLVPLIIQRAKTGANLHAPLSDSERERAGVL